MNHRGKTTRMELESLYYTVPLVKESKVNKRNPLKLKKPEAKLIQFLTLNYPVVIIDTNCKLSHKQYWQQPTHIM